MALFHFEDLSIPEIAVALDVPAGTIKTRLMHARRRLRAVLADWRTPPADIHALYPERLNLPAKTIAFVEFLSQRFARHLRAPGSDDAVW